MDDPQRRRNYAATAWNYAMQVLWQPAATTGERNDASIYIGDAVAHITNACEHATT